MSEKIDLLDWQKENLPKEEIKKIYSKERTEEPEQIDGIRKDNELQKLEEESFDINSKLEKNPNDKKLMKKYAEINAEIEKLKRRESGKEKSLEDLNSLKEAIENDSGVFGEGGLNSHALEGDVNEIIGRVENGEEVSVEDYPEVVKEALKLLERVKEFKNQVSKAENFEEFITILKESGEEENDIDDLVGRIRTWEERKVRGYIFSVCENDIIKKYSLEKKVDEWAEKAIKMKKNKGVKETSKTVKPEPEGEISEEELKNLMGNLKGIILIYETLKSGNYKSEKKETIVGKIRNHVKAAINSSGSVESLWNIIDNSDMGEDEKEYARRAIEKYGIELEVSEEGVTEPELKEKIAGMESLLEELKNKDFESLGVDELEKIKYEIRGYFDKINIPEIEDVDLKESATEKVNRLGDYFSEIKKEIEEREEKPKIEEVTEEILEDEKEREETEQKLAIANKVIALYEKRGRLINVNLKEIKESKISEEGKKLEYQKIGKWLDQTNKEIKNLYEELGDIEKLKGVLVVGGEYDKIKQIGADIDTKKMDWVENIVDKVKEGTEKPTVSETTTEPETPAVESRKEIDEMSDEELDDERERIEKIKEEAEGHGVDFGKIVDENSNEYLAEYLEDLENAKKERAGETAEGSPDTEPETEPEKEEAPEKYGEIVKIFKEAEHRAQEQGAEISDEEKDIRTKYETGEELNPEEKKIAEKVGLLRERKTIAGLDSVSGEVTSIVDKYLYSNPKKAVGELEVLRMKQESIIKNMLAEKESELYNAKIGKERGNAFGKFTKAIGTRVKEFIFGSKKRGEVEVVKSDRDEILEKGTKKEKRIASGMLENIENAESREDLSKVIEKIIKETGWRKTLLKKETLLFLKGIEKRGLNYSSGTAGEELSFDELRDRLNSSEENKEISGMGKMVIEELLTRAEEIEKSEWEEVEEKIGELFDGIKNKLEDELGKVKKPDDLKPIFKELGKIADNAGGRNKNLYHDQAMSLLVKEIEYENDDKKDSPVNSLKDKNDKGEIKDIKGMKEHIECNREIIKNLSSEALRNFMGKVFDEIGRQSGEIVEGEKKKDVKKSKVEIEKEKGEAIKNLLKKIEAEEIKSIASEVLGAIDSNQSLGDVSKLWRSNSEVGRILLSKNENDFKGVTAEQLMEIIKKEYSDIIE